MLDVTWEEFGSKTLNNHFLKNYAFSSLSAGVLNWKDIQVQGCCFFISFMMQGL